MKTPCCDDMRTYSGPCPDHGEDVHACPDALIHMDTEYGTVGIIVRDGGTACVDILFCPWCGKKVTA